MNRRLRRRAQACAVWMLALFCIVGRTEIFAADSSIAEVLVTASRFARERASYGGSASRLEASTITETAPRHADEILNHVPGAYLQRGSGQETLVALRSPVLTGAGACGAFLLLEDGIPLRPTGFCNVNALFEGNLEQAGAVEVLRGPASAAYGANAVHGIVNILSRELESLGRPALSLAAGDGGLRQLAFEASHPNNEAAVWGAYGFARRDDFFRADAGTEEAKFNGLVELPLANSALQLRVALSALSQETAGFIRGLDSYRSDALRAANANPEAFRDASSLRLSARWTSVPCADCQREVYARLRQSEMRFLQHFLLGKPLEDNAQRSLAVGIQERRKWLPQLDASWHLDFGAMRASLLEAQNGPTVEGSAAARAIRPAGRHYDFVVDGRSVALGGALDWAFAAQQFLQMQLHAERNTYAYDNHMLAGNTTENGISCGFGGCLFSRPVDRDDSFDNLSARLEWRVKPRANLTGYFALGRGFRPPEVNELYRLQRGQDIAAIDSENMSGVELGWHGTTPHAAWSVAAFAQVKRNVILRDANGFNVDNGETRHRGLEYEWSWRPNRSWLLAGHGSWAWHRYGFTRAIEGGEQIVAGRDIDTAPRHTHGLDLRWRPQAAWSIGASLKHVGRYFVDASAARSYPGHTLLDVQLRWQAAADLDVSLQLRNALDRRYADRADFAQGEYRYFPGRERRLSLELRWRREVKSRDNPAA